MRDTQTKLSMTDIAIFVPPNQVNDMAAKVKEICLSIAETDDLLRLCKIERVHTKKYGAVLCQIVYRAEANPGLITSNDASMKAALGFAKDYRFLSDFRMTHHKVDVAYVEAQRQLTLSMDND